MRRKLAYEAVSTLAEKVDNGLFNTDRKSFSLIESYLAVFHSPSNKDTPYIVVSLSIEGRALVAVLLRGEGVEDPG